MVFNPPSIDPDLLKLSSQPSEIKKTGQPVYDPTKQGSQNGYVDVVQPLRSRQSATPATPNQTAHVQKKNRLVTNQVKVENEGLILAVYHAVTKMISSYNQVRLPGNSAPPTGNLRFQLVQNTVYNDNRKWYTTNIQNCLPKNLLKTVSELNKTLYLQKPKLQAHYKEYSAVSSHACFCYASIMLLGFVYSIFHVHFKAYFSMHIIKAVVLGITSYLFDEKIRLRSFWHFVAVFSMSLFLAGFEDTKFVKKNLGETFNQDVVQSLESNLQAYKEGRTFLDPFFALRRVVYTCVHDPNSPECETDLKYANDVYKYYMPALIKTLRDESVVAPKDAIVTMLNAYNVPMQNDPHKLDLRFSEVLAEQTVKKYEDATNPVSDDEKDLWESQVLALAARRLNDGIYYYEHHINALRAQKTNEGFTNLVDKVIFEASPFDSMLLSSSWIGMVTKGKIVIYMIRCVVWYFTSKWNIFDYFFVDVYDWRNIKPPDSVVSYCQVMRCQNIGGRLTSLDMHTYFAKPRTDINVIMQRMSNSNCSGITEDTTFNVSTCSLIGTKCKGSLDEFNKKSLVKVCPDTCQTRCAAPEPCPAPEIVGFSPVVHATSKPFDKIYQQPQYTQSPPDLYSNSSSNNCTKKVCKDYQCTIENFANNYDQSVTTVGLGYILSGLHFLTARKMWKMD